MIAAALILAASALIAATAFALDRASAIRARRPWVKSEQVGSWALVESDELEDPEGVIEL